MTSDVNRTSGPVERDVEQDESVLIWFSGEEEKHLKLRHVSKIISVQRTVENLTLKAQLQEVELAAIKVVIKSLTAGNRSSGQSRQGQSETTTRNGGRTKEGDSRNDNEWVVQDKPGVYITHTSLPGGVRDLKRVRFSRRQFSEKQAEQWWAENRARVYKQYNVRMVDKSSVGIGSEDCGH